MPDSTEPFGACPVCHHHILLHCGDQGRCMVRLMESGYPDFASLPICGCTYSRSDLKPEENQ